MNIKHRPAKNKDIPQIKKLVYAIRDEYGMIHDEDSTDADLNDIEAHYQRGYFGLLFDESDAIKGTFALHHDSDTVCEIRKMYLLPSARGKGIGKWMLDFLLEKARSDGYKTVRLETAHSLKVAQAMYRKYGFEEVKDESISCGCDKRFVLHL